jgi:hypothetical protein
MPVGPARGVIQTYADASKILADASVIPSASKDFTWSLETALPWTGTSGVRDINADFTASYAQTNKYSSETKIYGGKVQVDKKITVESPDSVAYQEAAQIRALSHQLDIDVFEGAGGVTNNIRGFQYILENYEDFDTQTVNATATNTATVTLDMLDEAISKVAVAPSTRIYANNSVIRTINSLSRAPVSASMGVTRTLDQFGVYSLAYNGIPMISMLDGKNANMLSTTQADADANESDAQSLWIVTWGPENATLFSSNSTRVANGVPIPDIEEMTDGTNYRYIRFEWYVGLALQSIRSIARIRYLS